MSLTCNLSVRGMSLADLQLALDWASAEGWNPGLFDAEPFLAADPRGFFLAEVDDRPVGSISAVAYDDQFGFIGLYLVRPELRGGRVGVELGQTALEYLGQRTIGLDGVLAKQENYRRLGFRPAYRTVRYEGTGPGPFRGVESPAEFVDLRQLQLSELAAYDQTVFPTRREAFLEAWIRQPGTVSLGVLRAGRLAGYAVARPCRVGYKLGPLAADEPALAEVLMAGVIDLLAGETFFLDVPQPNQAAADLARRYDMKPVFETVRMYRGPEPKTDFQRVFGATTMEIG
jgi:GNAT superfamily N-acetyltransferase